MPPFRTPRASLPRGPGRLCAVAALVPTGCTGGLPDWPANQVELPGWGASDVPTNVVPLAQLTADDPVEARFTSGDTGAAIDADVATIETPSGYWAWITPSRELAPATEYRVRLLVPDDTTGTAAEGVGFTTGAGPDLDPPTGGALQSVEMRGDNLYVQVDDPAGPPGAAYIELEVASDAGFEDRLSLPLVGTSPDVAERFEVAALEFPDARWVERGDTLFFRSRAIDLAGNAGAWSDAVSARADSCATAPLGHSLLALGVAVLAVFRRLRVR
jgi:hypothetical protein